VNSHPNPGPFDYRVLRSCLVLQCLYPPYQPHYQRRLANCDWMPASYTSGQPSNPCRHSTCELGRRGVTLSLGRRAMAPGQLLHSALTRPSGAAAQRLKSRHPFVPAVQQLISISDNIHAAQWADHQWNAVWADNSTRLRTLIPDTGTPLRNDLPKKSLGPAQPPLHRCWMFPLLPVQMGYGLLCDL